MKFVTVFQYKDDGEARGDEDGLGAVLYTGGVAEVWKDNLLDKLSKKESEVETAEELFSKIRNKFEETAEEEKKVEQLRTIEQGRRMCNEYIQEFKITRENGYERWPLIEEFKRGLNGEIRRKLVKAKNPSSIIEEWQERAVRLDRNQRQSRVEKRMLERNVVYLQGNM